MPVNNYFPTPIYEHDFVGPTLAEIQKQIDAAMPRIRKLDLSNPWSDNVLTTFKYNSKNNLFIDFGMNKLLEGIVKHLNVYVNEMKYTTPIAFKNSWMNIYPPGTFQYAHHHSGSAISGTYYYQTNGNDGKIIFENPNPYLDYQLFPGTHGFNRLGVEPKVGRLVLFPSWLRHGVEMNKTDQERISISFNIG
jgi:uncharacterized protein (TIGR02466 family)